MFNFDGSVLLSDTEQLPPCYEAMLECFNKARGILSCNNNIKNWKLNENDMCDIFCSKHSIEHLLFEYHRAAKL